MATSLLRRVVGAPRDPDDPKTYHTISLVALLAWVGLGADGLSSSAYGPDEAFRALGPYTFLAVALALATTLTVLVISVAYSQIIRRFPYGGGGYVVATELLGKRWGVVSGSALLIDYVLTVSVSVAGGADQMFSVLPPGWVGYKLAVEAATIGLLILLNLRGVKESVTILAPIFGLFLVTHAILIVGGFLTHAGAVPQVAADVQQGFQGGLATLGAAGLFGVFLRAYSMGAGTYTGIEAVSNGIQIMREPKIRTATRTMLLMAISLAVTAGGILILYLLFQVAPVEGKTLNAVLLDSFAGNWRVLGFPVGHVFVVVALGTEAALLFVAAQTGFIDGPRVMGSMALDGWLPRRFGQLSDRLTMQNGVLLMGLAAIGTLVYTRGSLTALVTMYSINVFVTFSISQFGMLRFWATHPAEPGRGRGFLIHGVCFMLCAGILTGVVYEKFALGGWVTVVVTGAVVALCFLIRRHYENVAGTFKRLDDVIEALPTTDPAEAPVLDPAAPTAVLFVGGFSGLGVHALLTIIRTFPGHYRNFRFLSVAVLDAATSRGIDDVDALRERTAEGLRRYVEAAHRLGFAADSRMSLGSDALDEAEELAAETRRELRRPVFFLGKLIFEHERWYQKLLHNETAYALQRRLQFEGLNTMVLPVRVIEATAPATRPPSEPAGEGFAEDVAHPSPA